VGGGGGGGGGGGCMGAGVGMLGWGGGKEHTSTGTTATSTDAPIQNLANIPILNWYLLISIDDLIYNFLQVFYLSVHILQPIFFSPWL